MMIRRGTAALTTALLGASLCVAAAPAHASTGGVFPPLKKNLISYYDFEHPVPGDPSREADRGRSGTTINLINGGAAMRVRDGARRHAVQLGQVAPSAKGNDDWKAGVYSAPGVPSGRRASARRSGACRRRRSGPSAPDRAAEQPQTLARIASLTVRSSPAYRSHLLNERS